MTDAPFTETHRETLTKIANPRNPYFGQQAAYAALKEIERLRTRVNKLRMFQYENLGYGKFRCRSCGSLKQVDYGDHNTPTTEQAEPCSKNCPFQTETP